MKILANWGARKESAPLADSFTAGDDANNIGAGYLDSEPSAQVLRDRLMAKTATDDAVLRGHDADTSPKANLSTEAPFDQSGAPAQTSARKVRSAWDLAGDDDHSQYIGQPDASHRPVTSRAPDDNANAAIPAAANIAKPASDMPSKAARTRLIGFDKSDGSSVDVFEQQPGSVSGSSQFPVGWIIVVEGPGRGHAFTLHSGLSQIGRSDDQAVALDFGDMAISRSNHAAIAFDTETSTFMMGHGGKANIVRLNGKPVIANEEVADGDIITIGETTLQLKAFCGPDFTWEEREPETPEVFSIV